MRIKSVIALTLFVTASLVSICVARAEEQEGECLIAMHVVDTNYQCVLTARTFQTSIIVDSIKPEIGAIDLRLCYERDGMAFLNAKPGSEIDAWEYFSYRYQQCDDTCNIDEIRMVAIADLYSSSSARTEEIYSPTGPIGVLTFQFTSVRNTIGRCFAIRWCSTQCGDNLITARSGDTLYLDPAVTDPDCPTFPVGDVKEAVCLRDGWICNCDFGESSGEINLNGIFMEVGDLVLFRNYFIYGPVVWDPIYGDSQLLSTDLNNDGKLATVADLQYMIGVITGDNDPYPESGHPGEPGRIAISESSNDGAHVASISSPMNLGATHFIYRYENLIIGEPRMLIDADVDFHWQVSNGELRILLSNLSHVAQLPSGSYELFEIPVEGNGTLEVVEASSSTPDGQVVEVVLPARTTPTGFELQQNYPNPFNAGTVIEFGLSDASAWSVDIFNVLGERVRAFTGESEAGHVAVEWDATDEAGGAVSSGVYFYRVTALGTSATKKMLLLR